MNMCELKQIDDEDTTTTTQERRRCTTNTIELVRFFSASVVVERILF